MKASRGEILGAWLHLWTPPRDVEIPPFPRRWLVILALLVAAVAGLWLAVVGPAINDVKQRDADRQAAADARFRHTERARLVRDQRPHTARSVRAARLYASGSVTQARAVLLVDAESSVLLDARAREDAGEIDQRVLDVTCKVRRTDPAPRVRLGCFAATTRTERVAVGQSFLAAGSLRDGRYTWCHENPSPGEGATGRGVTVTLAPACTGR